MSIKTCRWCGDPLLAGQKTFCSHECHDLYLDTYGHPKVAKDVLSYDYSNYDPEDDKYGDFDIEEDGEIFDPEEE